MFILRANHGQPEYTLIRLFRPIGFHQHGASEIHNVIRITHNILYNKNYKILQKESNYVVP